jgi:hypothetical protein
MNAGRWVVAACCSLVVAGCAARVPVSSPSGPGAGAANDVMALSLTSAAAPADGDLRACGVDKYAEHVKGLGIVASARLLAHYVPLTGREPELQVDEPIFAVQYAGVIRLPLRGGPGSPAYKDIDGPTCVVLDGWPIWYVTGPWTDSLGNHGVPEPAPYLDRTLPSPLP